MGVARRHGGLVAESRAALTMASPLTYDSREVKPRAGMEA
jgi:hypothetical protein